MSVAVTFILMGCALLLSAFFSSTEIAYTSVNKLRLEALAEKGNKRAIAAKKISDRYDVTLSSLLIGNNLVNNMISSFATMLAVAWAAGSALGEGTTTTITSVIVTVTILIFGEIVPKIIAKQHSLGYACLTAYPLLVLSKLFYPISFLVTKAIHAATSRLTKTNDNAVTEEELSVMIDTAEEEGTVDEEQGELLHSALDYQETTVEDILVPRIQVEGINLEDTPEEIRAVCLGTIYSRLPVYEESLDHIIGILTVNHYLKAAADRPETAPDLRALVNDTCYVHKTAKLPNVLSKMQERQIHLAVVIDEYGGTMGIVTMEDILEQIVGDIWDESDPVEPEDIRQESENTYVVDGMTPIADFFEELEIDDRGFESEYTTMGGWAVEMLEEDPHVGDSFTWNRLTVTVLTMHDNLVGSLQVTVAPPEEEEE